MPTLGSSLAAVVLCASPAFAALTEVPPVDAPVGSAVPNSAPSAGSVSLAPALLVPAPLAALPLAAVSAPAAPIAAAPAAVAATAAPLTAPALAVPPAASAVTPASPGAVFGRRVQAPQQSVAGQESDGASGGEAAWTRSSALFDLSGEPEGSAGVLAAQQGSSQYDAGKVLARLRRAGENGEAGPGAIPGISGVARAGRTENGRSGETEKVLIGGKPWYLKRLGPSPEPVINALPVETRALNEAGLAAVLRADPRLSRSFSAPPRVSLFRRGKDVFVLSEGLPSVGDGESRRQDLSATQRADAAIIQLALGLGDMHGGDVLPLGGGRFGLVDFEKLSREPLAKATPQQIDEEVMLKNFPLVDRLSENDPALYRARFEEWRKDYEAAGRGRMDAALAASGWPRDQREAYLATVDRNVATYLDRLAPYLEYGNEWNARIRAARAEAARKNAPRSKGFFSGFFGPR